MGCGCSSSKPVFKLGTPLVSGGTVTPCFEDGRLFKIEKNGYWYFYNDTQIYKMVAKVEFYAGSQIQRATKKEGAERARITNHGDGSASLELLVLPLETLPLMYAKVINGFDAKFFADPFTAVERARAKEVAEKEVRRETADIEKVMRKHKKINNSHRLLKGARKSNKMFLDVYFPPERESLARSGLEKMRYLEEYFWQRPSDYLPGAWKKRIRLFDSSVNPRDIDQGALGDCYFLCACASLAEHKKDIEAIFYNPHTTCTKNKEEKHGGFRVILNLHGWWKQIIIDSYLPSRSILPAFARNRSRPNELWPSFLEKAYAKGYGSYQSIEAGFPYQAQEDLTGYPAYSFDKMWEEAVEDSVVQEKLFKMLERWNDKQYLISISTPVMSKTTMTARRRKVAQDLEKLFDKAGLATGHAYTVLDVRHFPVHRLCLLKIRNPWGNNVEWLGDWGDQSDKWKEYPTVKMSCRPSKKEDGIFWMEWNDVVNFFDSGSVCFRQGSWLSTWHNYRVYSQFHGNIPDIVLDIKCHENMQAFFTVHQKDKRGLPASDTDSKYAAIMVTVFEGELEGEIQAAIRSSGNNPEEPSVKYTFELARSASVKCELEEGKRYFVVPRRMTSANGNNQTSKAYVLSMHSSRKLSKGGSCGSEPTRINFLKLDGDNDVFRNMPKFPIGRVATMTSIYQVRHGTDFFYTRRGNTFNEGEKVNNVEFEQII